MPTTHTLEATRDTLHGHFSRDLTPKLTIQSGDTVHYTTLDSGWGLEPLPGGLYQFNSRREITDRPFGEHDNGHALTGPIFIEGAQPGMTLEIEIKTIRPGAYGFCLAGGWPSSFNERLGVVGQERVRHRPGVQVALDHADVGDGPLPDPPPDPDPGVLLVGLRQQRAGRHLALAGHGELRQQRHVDVDAHLVARSLALPLHPGVAV